MSERKPILAGPGSQVVEWIKERERLDAKELADECEADYQHWLSATGNRAHEAEYRAAFYAGADVTAPAAES